MDNDTGQLMAVKQVHVSKAGSSKVSEHVTALEAEVRLLQQLDHPNIVRYLSTETTNDALHIFLEFVPGGSIASLLAKFGHFRETVVKVYTRQILLGLEYLHAHGIIHRDIKGANILVDNTGLVKLADFGASKKIEDLVTIDSGFKSMKGTPYWMAPEIIKQSGHGRQADIWSVACTVIEMATGRPPWSGLGSQVAAMFHIASSKGPPPIPEHLSAENWKDRPLAAQLLQHPFLASVPPRTVAAPLASIATGRAAGVGGAPAIPPVVARAAPPATQAGEHAAGGEGAQGDLDSPAIKAWRTPPKAGESPSGSSNAGRVDDGEASDPDTPPGPSGDPSPVKGSEGPARTASQGRGVAAGPGSACGAFGGGAAEGAGVDAGTIPGPFVVAARGAVAAGKAAHTGSPLPCRTGPGLSQRGAGERGGDGGQSCVDATGTSGEGGGEAGAPVRSGSTCPGRRERPAATSIRAAPSAGVRQSMPALLREREASRSPTERALSGSAAFLPGRAGSVAGRHLHRRPSGEGTAACQQADLAPGAEAPVRAARSTVARPATERAGVPATESLPPSPARRRHSDASPRDPVPPPAADSWEEAAAVATAAGPDAREDKDLGSWWPPSPARDHMVWTNEDGDIDALPWDVGRSSMAAPAGLFRAALG
ncbi:Mitogen-activated protein kinase kinase kinase 2 [Auxenochlorella protothecoides]|uniref:Mitogen-activated protein kinase kinase kinase 2 n=1 Tax=Auxenochlorella protothecoides TaxID=3075 RepID=A0A087SMD6_AUXPR|nr:Mitogen-activated protein kinase kinase kinase 2 [Auxenochlorella protothecoides]KFM26890.1 Mitogen-activated protein kinase kinase kinase 2 [Auxenochlorella protothecoides]